MKALVLVRPKPGILDPQGEAVRGGLDHLGFTVREARIGRLIELELDSMPAGDARSSVEQMCESLLTNPLIESYEVIIEDTDGTVA